MKQLQQKHALIIFAIILCLKFVESTPEWAITENNEKYLIENKYEVNLTIYVVNFSCKNKHFLIYLVHLVGVFT